MIDRDPPAATLSHILIVLGVAVIVLPIGLCHRSRAFRLTPSDYGPGGNAPVPIAGAPIRSKA